MTVSSSQGGSLSLGLAGLERAALSLEQLRSLYAATDWRVVTFHPRAPRAYGGFPAIAMFKALALPYLVNIQSEAALARELGERDALRQLCGFGVKTPTRAMLWHFRHTPPDFHPQVMPRVLVALVLSGQEPNRDLPLVFEVPDDAPEPDGEYFVFQIDVYRPEIEMWTTPSERPRRVIETAGKVVSELYRELRSAERSRSERGLGGQVGLPAEVRTRLINDEMVRFGIDKPDWLRPGSRRRSRSADTVTSLGSALAIPYAACNIIVSRDRQNGEEVLLARRLAGNGKGHYALPGGKAKEGESLENCTKRELLEETGLEGAGSRPVSIRLVRLPGHPRVFSVGALVSEFKGELRRREPEQHAEWEWFGLEDLPAPLFLPAQLALHDYRRGRFENQQWSDVEVQRRASTRRPVQLRFERLLGE